MYEALYYRVKGDVVICELCPHMCQLKHDEKGLCKTRVCKNGKLYTLAYANPCALHVDPVEKKPLNHFFPGTSTFSLAANGCNLSCLNCQNSSISQVAPEPGRCVLPSEIVDLALQKGCSSVSYTYTDPVVYFEYMLETASLAHACGLKNIIVSAGYINAHPLEKMMEVIDAANIDLKCFEDTIYQKLCGVRLKPVLNTLLALRDSETWLEITNLIIPGYTDGLDMINEMLDWLLGNGFESVPIHFNRFVPSHRLRHLEVTPESTLLQIAALAKDKGMEYVYVGNVAGHSFSDTVCSRCGTVYINRTHYQIEMIGGIDGKCNACGQRIKGVWA